MMSSFEQFDLNLPSTSSNLSTSSSPTNINGLSLLSTSLLQVEDMVTDQQQPTTSDDDHQVILYFI